MMIRLLTEEVQASETSLQRAEREYLSSLWAAATFPASCLWCEEAGEPLVIESREECGGFDMDTGRPICDGCASVAEDLRHL